METSDAGVVLVLSGPVLCRSGTIWSETESQLDSRLRSHPTHTAQCLGERGRLAGWPGSGWLGSGLTHSVLVLGWADRRGALSLAHLVPPGRRLCTCVRVCVSLSVCVFTQGSVYLCVYLCGHHIGNSC